MRKPLRCIIRLHQLRYEDRAIAGMVRVQDVTCEHCDYQDEIEVAVSERRMYDSDGNDNLLTWAENIEESLSQNAP